MSDYFDRIERQLVRAAETQPRRLSVRPRVVLGPVIAATVVILVIAVVVIAGGTGRRRADTAPASGPTPTAIVLASPASGPSPVAGLNADATTLRHRLRASFPDVRVARVGGNVVLSNISPAQRPAVLRLTVPGRLRFLDWEANALLPGGQTAASGLRRQDPHALAVSQGAGSAAPGYSGAGGLPLYQAVKLAAQQTRLIGGPNVGRLASQYFLFGPRCRPTGRQSCLLAGPAPDRTALLAGLPPNVKASHGRSYVVPPGTLVLQAATSSQTGLISFDDPTTRYFVLRDDAALTGAEVHNARVSTDQSGNPDVSFSFSPAGERAFQHKTALIAHRGDQVSGFGQTLNQHFAVTLDNRILTVPSIDFKTYPDGVTANAGADISGGLTKQSARELATLLRTGPLAVPLTPRS
jgi:hypothetical protein